MGALEALVARRVQIYFAGNEENDRRFALRIAESVMTWGEPQLLDVDELNRMDARDENRPSGYVGTAVVVLSRHLLGTSLNREKVLHVMLRADLPGHTGFYICRGVRVAELAAMYPAMCQLMEKVDIGEEGQLPEMLWLLRRYAGSVPARLRTRLRLRLFYPASVVVFASGLVLHLALPFVGLAALVWLMVSSFILGAPSRAAEIWLLTGAGYAAGWWANKLPPLDLCAWLGPQWLPQFRECASFAQNMPPAMSPKPWLSHGFFQRTTRQKGHAICSLSRFYGAVSAWSGYCRNLRIGVGAAAIALPGTMVYTLLHHKPSAALASIGAFLFGAMYPVLFRWASDLQFTFALQQHRMEIRPADAPTATALVRQVHRRTRPHVFLHRRWRMRDPDVFISYGWADAGDCAIAEALAANVEKLGWPVFLDKAHIDHFAAWSAMVATALGRCTHQFVILGPGISTARTCHREVRLSLLRWRRELLPTVICVVDPDDAEALLRDDNLQPELRQVLYLCPRLTHEQARNADWVMAIMNLRFRQGLARDWLTLLMPGVHAELYRRRMLEAATLADRCDQEPTPSRGRTILP